MLVRRNLFVPGKAAYVRGGRPKVDCILCAVRDGAPEVESLVVHETPRHLVSCNLYPFNAGHVMIFPRRHITCLREMARPEAAELHDLTARSMDLVERLYECQGFNVGYNIGGPSGGSIPHLHLHIIPRYDREMGLIDIIGGAKIVIEDPRVTMERLRGAFAASGRGKGARARGR